ncbi:hypothetical protein PR048_014029 [Dryococelus australis]|uniref:Uncharacterized protein n=1 Tax=Dryococelus australis TaxID=614101 RepID=A0ABQ9HUR4_9NEOP|nr:hypothetical protein PR048_014029 [Dryococelus australis]
MEQRRNARAWETGDPGENPPPSGIIRHDFHFRKYTCVTTCKTVANDFCDYEKITPGLVGRLHSERAGTVAVNLRASHQGDLGSIPGRVTPDLRTWESCRTIRLVGGSSRGSPVSPALSFRRCSILASITLIGS